MRPTTIASCAALAVLAIPAAPRAQGFLNPGGGGLDPKFCESKALRQTVVYVDDMIMRDGATDWATNLYNKLKATLVPGERVTVVELAPADGLSKETWAACWPDYSTEDRKKLAASTSFFGKNPLKALAEQQNVFGHNLGAALAGIYDQHRRPDITVSAANPPHKAILAALSSDGARYAQTQVTIRSIIYSDMAENSEMGSVFKPAAQPINYGRKFGTYLRSSVVYAFGVASDIRGGDGIQEAIRSFWTAALGSMSATIGGLGADLNVPNTLPVQAFGYDVDLKEDGQLLNGKLSLLVDADGGLVDSWIGISRLSSAAVTGTMRCTASGAAACSVRAVTAHGIITDSPSEALVLSGSSGQTLTGTIGIKGSSVMLPVTATPIAP